MLFNHHRNAKDRTPAGSDSIPAPTMFFTKFTSICCTPPEKIVKGISFAPWLLDQTLLVSVKLGNVFSPYLSSIFIRPAKFRWAVGLASAPSIAWPSLASPERKKANAAGQDASKLGKKSCKYSCIALEPQAQKKKTYLIFCWPQRIFPSKENLNNKKKLSKRGDFKSIRWGFSYPDNLPKPWGMIPGPSHSGIFFQVYWGGPS